MTRLAALLLSIIAVVGIALHPASAFAPAMSISDMGTMSKATMPGMQDCTKPASKEGAPKPCKCGLASCIAMMTGGTLMLAYGSVAIAIPSAGERQDRRAIIAALRGGSTAPEPEPPSIPI